MCDGKSIMHDLGNEYDPYSSDEYGDYFCPVCKKYVPVLDKDIKVKTSDKLLDLGIITNDGKIDKISKVYGRYEIGYFACPECRSEVIISESLQETHQYSS